MSDPQGLAFDRLAEDYDLGRSGWPPSMLDGIEGETVLDLSAGTGKLTSVLVERYAQVIGNQLVQTASCRSSRTRLICRASSAVLSVT